MMHDVLDRPPVHALLAEGTTVCIRPVKREDQQRLRGFYEEMSPENLRLRFFGASRRSAAMAAARACAPVRPGYRALLAEVQGRVIGLAEYDTGGEADEAEISVAVAEGLHHRGVGTLLVEHLISAARVDGITTFTADALGENHEVLRLFADLGLRTARRFDGPEVRCTIRLDQDDAYLSAVEKRGRAADVASLQPLFRPDAVAVVGAGRGPGSVGRAILHHLKAGDCTRRLFAVNPAATAILGVPCHPSVSALPRTPDLAVLAVPAASVPTTAEECGRAGVRAFLVVTAGLDAEQARALMAACRAYGMRLVGPNCLGISNTDPDLRLDATFAAVDATAAVTEEQLGECVDGLMRYGGVDAVLVALVPTAVGTATGDDLVRGLTGATVRRTRPIAVVRLEQDVPVTLLPAADGGTIPSYAEPHAVARALTHAARRASWLARPVGTVPELDGVDAERAHEIAGTYLAAQPEGGWPDPRTCAELLDCYGIPQIPWAWAESEDDAVLAARRLRGIDGVVAVVDELSWRMDDTHLRPDRQALHGAADDWLREM